MNAKDLEAEIERLKGEREEKDRTIKRLESKNHELLEKLKESYSSTYVKKDDHEGSKLHPLVKATNKKDRDQEAIRCDETVKDASSTIHIQTIYQGSGDEMPSQGDVVKIHFTIALENNQETEHEIIEDSRMRYGGDPFSFLIGKNQVIEGVELALLKMHKAEITEVFIPAHLAYGEFGFACDIPVGSDLHCRIELIDFWKYEAPERPLFITSKPPKNI